MLLFNTANVRLFITVGEYRQIWNLQLLMSVQHLFAGAFLAYFFLHKKFCKIIDACSTFFQNTILYDFVAK